MHVTKQEPAGERITTREIADAIDELIMIRTQITACPNDDGTPPRELLDRLEIVKRRIADGLKDHSGAKGVFHGGK